MTQHAQMTVEIYLDIQTFERETFETSHFDYELFESLYPRLILYISVIHFQLKFQEIAG